MKNKIVQIVFFTIVAVLMFFYIRADAKDKDTYIDSEYIGYITEISDLYGICPELIEAIIESESSGNPKAQNGSCKGLMQINDKCHTERMKELGVTDIYDPFCNILVGADYLAELFEEYEDVGVVLLKYNGDSIGKLMSKGELSKYAEKILERSQELERVHGK